MSKVHPLIFYGNPCREHSFVYVVLTRLLLLSKSIRVSLKTSTHREVSERSDSVLGQERMTEEVPPRIGIRSVTESCLPFRSSLESPLNSYRSRGVFDLLVYGTRTSPRRGRGTVGEVHLSHCHQNI